MKLHRMLSSLLLMLATLFSYAQTPVKMSDQPGLTFTEKFDSINSKYIGGWTDNFASGTGAEHWKSVGINSGGTIPDGITTTIATDAFATTYLSSGVHRSPGTVEPARYLVFLVNGGTDNSDALAVDFYMDFTAVNASHLSFDVNTINNGVSTSNRVSTLQLYYSLDGNTFTELPGASYIATNYSSSAATISVSLPTEFNNASTAILRFYVNNGTGGDNGSRPQISIDNLTITAAPQEVLPVTLQSFTAQKAKGNVILQWITASEQHSGYFELQRSYNGYDYTAIATIPANGDTDSLSSYQFVDAPYPYHQIFYRLKIIDKDGRFKYSRAIYVSNSFDGTWQLFPNPAHDQILLRWNVPAEHPTLIQLISSDGKIMRNLYMQAGDKQVTIPVYNLPAGRYWIKIGDQKTAQVLSFIKQ